MTGNYTQRGRGSIFSPIPDFKIKDVDIHRQNCQTAVITPVACRKAISIKTVQKVIALTVCTVLFFVSVFYFDFGFDIYLGNHYIGTTKGYVQAAEIIENLSCGYTPEFYLKIIPKDGYSSKEMLEINMLIATGKAGRAVQCILNNGAVFFAKDTGELNIAIDGYTSGYTKYGEAQVDVAIKKYDAVAFTQDILDSKEIITFLTKNNADVKTVELVSKEVELPYETQHIEDGTKPEGTVIVDNPGKNGTEIQEIKIYKTNGETTHQEIINRKTVVPAVARVEISGTRKTISGQGTGSFIAPVKAPVTSSFGSRWGRQHKGTDFGAETGDNIVAADSGTVSFSGWQDGFGNLIIIDHKNGYETYYAHCSELYVSKGCLLNSGDLIASVGNTGNSTGPHLHFEIRYKGEAVDAMSYIQ